MSEPILQVRNLSVHYGGIQAVRGIEFSLNEGEQGTLLGANGAGKSSTSVFRASVNVKISWPGCSPAVNSSCWLWAGRCSASRAC